MATTAALRLYRMAGNTAGVVAIELLAACQGVEFHRPLRTSAPLEATLAAVREVSARLTRDRPLSGDIQVLQKMILAGRFAAEARTILPSWHA